MNIDRIETRRRKGVVLNPLSVLNFQDSSRNSAKKEREKDQITFLCLECGSIVYGNLDLAQCPECFAILTLSKVKGN